MSNLQVTLSPSKKDILILFETTAGNKKEVSFYVIISNKTITAMAELPAAQRECNSEGNTYRTFDEEVIVRSHR